jgi:WD40 repeat protein
MKARLWDPATGKLKMSPMSHDGPVQAAAFSPDGSTVITGGWDRVVRLWNAHTGAAVSTPLRHDGLLRTLAISPNGQMILTGSYDRKAQLWDKLTGKPIGPAFRHEAQVWFVAFGPDGRSVLSGGQQKTAQLWTTPKAMDAPVHLVERSIQVSTGMELLPDGSLHMLDYSEWNERRTHSHLSP